MSKRYALFLGSSNTFGANLHLFNGQYTTEEQMKEMTQKKLTEYTYEDYQFMSRFRWSSLVANNINCKEINVARCGGGVAESLYVIQELQKGNIEIFRDIISEPIIPELQNESFDFDKVEYIFIEFSMLYSFFDRWMRTKSAKYSPRTALEIENFLKNDDIETEELRNKITEWLVNFDPISYTDVVMKNFSKELKNLVNQGKKICIVWWRATTTEFVENERFPELSKYVVKFPTEQKQDNIFTEEFLLAEKATIYQDHPLGTFLPHKDYHGSIRGHQLVANKILDYIHEKETTNSW